MVRDHAQEPGDNPSFDAPDEPLEELDERLLSQLIDFDEAVTSGTIPHPMDLSDLPAEQARRLGAIRDCLLLLAGASRVRDADAAGANRAPATGERAAAGKKRSGDRFGRFELLRRLGFGGAGVVYLAHDPGPNRLVALKVPLPSWFNSDDLRQRFLREGEAAALLNHPNIVTVYEVAEYGPVCYIASEYCSGPSLAAFLDSQVTPVSSRAAAELVATLADAMQHAHVRGVLHRDLKPSNIFLVPTGDDPNEEAPAADDVLAFTPKIGDFGLAKLQKRVGNQTRSGAVVGSLFYMSPEQAQGSGDEITVQTDVYALGAILYALLTGEPPLHGATDVATLQMIVSVEPQAPRRFRPDIPPDLNAICLKCLEKNPRNRYESATALAEDLRRFLSNRPTIARELTTLARAYRWTQRYPAHAALLAVSIAALLTVIGSTVAYNARLRTAVAHAQRETNAGRRLLYSSEIRLAQDAWKANEFLQCSRILARQIPQDGEHDLREFAWHYLWKQCHSELLTLRGHRGDVYNVKFTTDGKSLVSGGQDGTVRLWDIESGKQVRAFSGHTGEVNTVVTLPEGRVASASDDQTVRIWDTRSGHEVRRLDVGDGLVFGLTATPNGKRLAAGSHGGSVSLWDVATGERIWNRDGDVPVESVSFSPGGFALVVGYFDRSLRWLNGRTGEVIYETTTAAQGAVSAVYSPNFARIAVAGRTGFLATYRHRSGRGWGNLAASSLDQTAIGIHAIAFSPRDNTLAVGRRDGLVELWNAGESLEPSRLLPGHGARVWSVDWAPDGQSLASAAGDGTIKLWNATGPRYWCDVYPRLPSEVRSIAFSPDKKSVLTGSLDGCVRRWDRGSRQVEQLSLHEPNDVVTASYVDGGRAAIVLRPWSGVERWDFASDGHALLAKLPELAYVQAVSKDGTLLAVGCEHSTAMLLDAETGAVRHRLKTESLAVKHLALSPDARWLATAGVGEIIEIWSTQSGRRVRTLPGHANRTLCLAFSPDGAMLASGGSDRKVRLWDVASGRLLATLIGQSAVTAVAISPDGRNLVNGTSHPASLQVWDLMTRQPLVRSGESSDAVTALAFAPDGRAVIAGSASGTMIEWSLDDGDGFRPDDAPPQRVALGEVRLGWSPPATSEKSAVDPLRMMQGAHEYARREGFVTGYPTFHRGRDGQHETMQVVLLDAAHARTILVSLDEFTGALAFGDWSPQRESLLVRLLKTADSWFRDKGYKGALPSFFAVRESGVSQFEFTLLSSTAYKRRRLDLAELRDLADVESVFQQVHSWAVVEGHISALPTFREQSGQLQCVMIGSAGAEVRHVPLPELMLEDH